MGNHISGTCQNDLNGKQHRCNKQEGKLQRLRNTRCHTCQCCGEQKSACLFFLLRLCSLVHSQCRTRQTEDHKDKLTGEIPACICAEMNGRRISQLGKENGDGELLSGGEAQKAAIARALYKDAPIVILDEPTAALDPISEAEIYENFSELVKDKTSIFISHRMSSCKFCDEIIVFDQGQIIQRGTHDQLAAQPGLYQELWEAQAQYYRRPALKLI